MRIKDDDLARYAVGGLAAAVFLALTVWVIRAEGERTRQAIRDAAAERQERAVNWPDPPVAPPFPTAADVPDAPEAPGTPDAEAARTTLMPEQETDTVNPVGQPPEETEADFDWDDKVIFPGLPPPSTGKLKPQTQRKP